MKYIVAPIDLNGDYMWSVFETETDSIVSYHHFEEDAEDEARFMEKGGAFAGWTPLFMLQRVALASEINSEFNALLAAS